MRKIVILGNGIAGITAARHLRKRCDDPILVISGESDHFFSRTALMYIYMGHMKYEHTKPYEDWFWDKNRIEVRRLWIASLDLGARCLVAASGERIPYDVLVLATGSKSNRFGWPGQDLRGVQGLYNLQDLETMEEHTAGVDRAVVVGGGLIGIEMAEMLRTRGIDVTLLVREPHWMSHAYPLEESQMIEREIRRHGVDLRLSSELERIEGDAVGRAETVITKDGAEIPARFVGLTVGVSPNIDFLRGSGLELDRGILVDEYLRTSAPDVYAVGDCAQVREPKPGRRPVEPLWYTGRIMGHTAGLTIAGEETKYDPGAWFNSAKFFDLEWQVYGSVPATPGDGESTIVWVSDDERYGLRLNYRDETLAVVGFQTMGIRYRQEACERWIAEERPMPWVLANLRAANFDPETYATHEQGLVDVWNAAHPEAPVELRAKRGLGHFLKLHRPNLHRRSA
ncbi:MAG: FAD-dependent oxidoreductase [Acidobacteriota bacterium]